jgi:hypothetical protein
MTTRTKTSLKVLAFATLTSFASCQLAEDPGALQPATEYYELADFTGVSIGDAIIVDVQQDDEFSIRVKGDQRNLDDLDVFVSENKLLVQFEDYERRRHDTYVYITMPSVEYMNFSGAVTFTVEGFVEEQEVKVIASGASNGMIDLYADALEMDLSGASRLDLAGECGFMSGSVSGSSTLSAFTFYTAEANLNVSGASSAKVTIANDFVVDVSGASTVIYRGNPSVSPNVSGASTLSRD